MRIRYSRWEQWLFQKNLSDSVTRNEGQIALLIMALRKYLKSESVRKEKSDMAKSLGEVIKQRRRECKMTQEFVADAIGVSRQAVSKWESGASDPSTSNLSAPAKLFGTTAEEMLRELKQ